MNVNTLLLALIVVQLQRLIPYLARMEKPRS